MKFSLKMILGTTVIISVLFSIGGIVMVNQNYEEAFSTTITQNTEQHTLSRYSLESNCKSIVQNGQDLKSEKLAKLGENLSGYAEGQSYLLAILDEKNNFIFSNIPKIISHDEIAEYLKNSEDAYTIKQKEDKTYMLMASAITVGSYSFSLLSVYDITHVFTERERQRDSFMKLDLLIITAAVVVIYLLSRLLTAPIKKLNTASKRIAAGAYQERTQINSRDEIGELSGSFNQMSQAVEEHITKLNEDVKRREEFVSDFSHEIKTPMTAIIGYADLLRSSDCDRSVQVKAANYIYKECKRLGSLSKNMLELMELSESEPVLTGVSTGRVASQLEKIMIPVIGEFQLIIDMPNALVSANEVLLVTLIKNLLDNAVKAKSADGAIRLTGRQTGSCYEFSVSDKGCGIPEDKIPYVIGAFYRVDQSRARENGGNGIGLSLCKKICDLHHTKMIVESEVNEGTTVRFTLEVYNEEAR